MPLDDAHGYPMLAPGGASGAFQFESNVPTEGPRAMRCDRFGGLVPMGECRELPRQVPGLEEAVEVLPPHVNESGWKFTVTEGRKVRLGLGAVRGVGAGAVDSILRAREEGGPFSTLFEFLERIDLRALNKRACEALIAAGALDGFGHRAQLLGGLDAAYGEVQAREAEEAAGQASLFGGGGEGMERPDPELPTLPEWPEQDRLTREKQALGFYISGHPLDRHSALVAAFGPANSANLPEFAGQEVELACVVTKVARQISRRDNTEWGRITIEDFHGTASVLAFRETWQRCKKVLEQDSSVLIRGKVSGRERDEEDPPIFLDDAEDLEAAGRSGRVAVAFTVESGEGFTGEQVGAARRIVEEHPGAAPLELHLENGSGPAARLRSGSLAVDPSRPALNRLEELLGAGRVRVVKAGG